MSDPARNRMTVDEFIAWAMEQPETEHYELSHGEVVAMAPERVGHAQMKFEITRRLADAIASAGLDCTAIIEGPGVQVDDETFYQPDAIVTCKPELRRDDLYVQDPVIVVEVLSPSTQHLDTNAKLTDYFKVASLRHYLIVRLQPFIVTHFARDDVGNIQIRLLPGGGRITFDPPGFSIELTAPKPT